MRVSIDQPANALRTLRKIGVLQSSWTRHSGTTAGCSRGYPAGTGPPLLSYNEGRNREIAANSGPSLS